MVAIRRSERNRLLAVSLGAVVILAVMGMALGGGFSPATARAGMETDGTSPGTGSISVTGLATVKVRPDTVTLNLGVETWAATAGDAAGQCAAAMNRVINALAGAGVPRANIQTSNLSLWAEHEYSERGGATKVIGYRASNQVNVTSGSLDKVGELIDKAIAAGANTIRGISFSLADSRALYLEAVQEAVRDARAKAEALASAAGVRVGDVLNMSLDSYYGGPVIAREAAMGAGAMPIEPGQVEMQVTVRIEYGIR